MFSKSKLKLMWKAITIAVSTDYSFNRHFRFFPQNCRAWELNLLADNCYILDWFFFFDGFEKSFLNKSTEKELCICFFHLYLVHAVSKRATEVLYNWCITPHQIQKNFPKSGEGFRSLPKLGLWTVVCERVYWLQLQSSKPFEKIGEKKENWEKKNENNSKNKWVKMRKKKKWRIELSYKLGKSTRVPRPAEKQLSSVYFCHQKHHFEVVIYFVCLVF